METPIYSLVKFVLLTPNNQKVRIIVPVRADTQDMQVHVAVAYPLIVNLFRGTRIELVAHTTTIVSEDVYKQVQGALYQGEDE